MVIPLTQGKVTFIDDADIPLISDYKWRARKSSYSWYVVTTVRVNGVKKDVYMHRLLLGCSSGEEGHHKDGDGMNNHRYNLEKCSRKRNLGYRKWGTS